MPDKHARLGPSGAHRWLICTKSPALEATLPEKTSIYAEKGRLAHELAELKVRKWGIEPIGARSYNNRVKKIKEALFNDQPLWDDSMDVNTDVYLDFIKRIANEQAEKPFLAVEQRVDLTAYIPESFGTADCILIGGQSLHVVDYKNGTGVVVSPVDNIQMKLYALGAFLKYGMLFPIEVVRMSIVQPNVTKEVETWEIALVDLLSWADSIKATALKAYNDEGKFVPGDHCKFCRASATCRANAEAQLYTEGFAPMLPPLISLEEASGILKRTRQLVSYVKKLEDYVLAQCLAGNEVPGWKAVEGRSQRKFSDLEAAFAKAQELGVKEELLYERKPITLAQLEKAMGEPLFEKMSNFVLKPPGSPTLVEATDKRNAITNRVSAEDEFQVIEVAPHLAKETK